MPLVLHRLADMGAFGHYSPSLIKSKFMRLNHSLKAAGFVVPGNGAGVIGPSKHGFPHQIGFTLIEALIALALLGLLAVFAVPNLQTMMSKNKINSIEQDIVRQLQSTQLKVMSNKALSGVIAPIDNDWSNGWEVTETFSRMDSADAVFENNFERSIRDPGFTLTVEDLDTAALDFGPTGQLLGQSRMVKIVLCYADARDKGRRIEILRTGLIRSTNAEPDDCDE